MLWWVGTAFLVAWLVLTFLMHKAGFVHILLLASISLLVVQLAAHRKTKLANRQDSRNSPYMAKKSR